MSRVAGVAPIAPGIIFDMFAQEERALAMGFFHWGIYLGNGLTFVVGKYITEMNLFNAVSSFLVKLGKAGSKNLYFVQKLHKDLIRGLLEIFILILLLFYKNFVGMEEYLRNHWSTWGFARNISHVHSRGSTTIP